MAPKVKPSLTLTYIASMFAIILWGMSYIWTDRLIDLGIPVFCFVFVRILIAGLVLFLFNTAYGRIKRIQKRGKFLCRYADLRSGLQLQSSDDRIFH